jgi:hypothetical protein
MAKTQTAFLAIILLLLLAATPLNLETAAETANTPTNKVTEDSWIAKTAMPQGGAVYGVATVNGKIYAFGEYWYRNYKYFGDANTSAKADFSTSGEYNPATDTWVKKEPMQTQRINFATAVWGAKIYIFGGQTFMGSDALSTVEVYDPATNHWTYRQAMPNSAAQAEAHNINGKIYIIGSTTQNIQVYEPESDSWTTAKPSPQSVYAFTSAVLDGRIYIIGGQEHYSTPAAHGGSIDDTRSVNTVQIFDPKSGNWTFGTPIPKIVAGAAAAATTGIKAPKGLYVFGSYSDGATHNLLVQIYSPAMDSWASSFVNDYTIWSSSNKHGDIPTDCTSAVTLLDDTFFLIGGSYKMIFTATPLSPPEYNPPPPFPAGNYQYIPFGYGTFKPIPAPPPTPSPTPTPTPEPIMLNIAYCTIIAIVVLMGVVIATLMIKTNKVQQTSKGDCLKFSGGLM